MGLASRTHAVAACGPGGGYRENDEVSVSPGHAPADMVPMGSRDSYLRILTEYGLAEDEIRGLSIMHPAMAAGGSPDPREYLVHASLLRSHGEFPCAGDQQTRSFCEEIAHEMVTLFGIPFDQAVARVNRQWSAPAAAGRTPRT
jgi:hypothetical protein